MTTNTSQCRATRAGAVRHVRCRCQPIFLSARKPSFTHIRRAHQQAQDRAELQSGRLVELADGEVLAARFLSGWCPPRYFIACSEAPWVGPDGARVLRNDTSTPACRKTPWRTACGGKRVIAASFFR